MAKAQECGCNPRALHAQLERAQARVEEAIKEAVAMYDDRGDTALAMDILEAALAEGATRQVCTWTSDDREAAKRTLAEGDG